MVDTTIELHVSDRERLDNIVERLDTVISKLDASGRSGGLSAIAGGHQLVAEMQRGVFNENGSAHSLQMLKSAQSKLNAAINEVIDES